MRAFFDIDTQIDFLYPSGALYGKGGESLIAPIAALNRYAVANAIPLVSTMCAHGEDAGEFQVWPPHCVAGTWGQRKPASLLFGKQVVVPNRPVQLDLAGANQILLEKNDLDLFTNPNAVDVLDFLDIDEVVVYGAFTEYCVKCAVMGLMKWGRNVKLVLDATAALDEAAGLEVLKAFLGEGGQCVTSTEILV